MIDIETDVFSGIVQALKDKYSGLVIRDELVKVPDVFPCVTVEQTDNAVNEQTNTDMGEYSALLTYEVNIYSNLEEGRKAQCKAILADIDAVLCGLGFVRQAAGPDRDREDFTYYQLTARYRAQADKSNMIF